MKKWIGPLLAFLLILILGIGFVSGSFSSFERTSTITEKYSILSIQEEKEGGSADPHLIQVLKEIQKKLDQWLRRLNDRIEKEDVTRFGVRFLEMIRNVLEWVKEKVDAQIESYEKEKPIRKQKKGTLRETSREVLRFREMG